MEPSTLLSFCIKIVLDTSPSREYTLLDIHGPYMEVESQTKQILWNTHITIILKRQNGEGGVVRMDSWAWMGAMKKEGIKRTLKYGPVDLFVLGIV